MNRRFLDACRRVGLMIATVALILGAGLTPVAAAPVPFPEQPLAGWSTNGTVYAVTIVGDVVYLGGQFTQVRGPGGSPTQSRVNVAAIDRVTGGILPFRADTNAVVRDIVSDGDTTWLGGGFTTVNGTTRRRVVAVNATTGAVRTGFSVNGSATVYGMALNGGTLYAGGTFTNFGGSAQGRMVALDAQTGAVRGGFRANANASVQDIEMAPDGTRVYAGGQFTQIGGAARANVAALDPVTGGALAPAFSQTGAQAFDVALNDAGTRLFAGLGGGQNRVAAYNTATGARLWSQVAMGDTQAVDHHGGNVYFGFHDGFGGDRSVRLLVADATTGALENAFRPRIDSYFGVWAIDATGGGLAVGGTFTTFEGVATRGIAVVPPAVSDTQAPSAPTGLGAGAVTADAVTLRWNPSTDDQGVVSYDVRRDGTIAASVAGTTATVDGLSPGTAYTFTVRARDAAGNTSAASAPVEATTHEVPIAAGSQWRYRDDGVDLGTAWRAPAFDDSGWSSGPAQLGFGDGDEATVLQSGHRTYYFRRTFTLAGAPDDATVRVRRDDGIVVYVNGVEVLRDNVPGGTVSAGTQASSAIAGAGESAWIQAAVPGSLLQAGDNVVAAEVHQVSNNSSDVSFDLALEAP